MKILFSLLIAAVLCGTLHAELDRKFSPPLELDGKKALVLDEKYQFDPLRGATFIFTGRYTPEKIRRSYNMATLFCKRGEFLFGFRNRKLYFIPANAGDGRWNYTFFAAGVSTDREIKPGDDSLHQFVATVSRYVEPAQGIDQTDVKLYLDGALVAGRRFDRFDWKDTGNPLLGCGVLPGDDTFKDKIWNFPGSVERLQVLDRALTDDDIRNLVLADKRLKPNFPVPKKLTQSELAQLTPAKDAKSEEKARLSALLNAAKLGRIDWKKAAADKHASVVLADGESAVTILDDGKYASVTSFYDFKAGRELLAWNNPFFEVSFFDQKRKEYILSGSADEVTRRLSVKPYKQNGAWHFAFEGENRKSDKCPFQFRYTMKCKYTDDRFEYELDVQSSAQGGRLQSVKFPALRLNSFRNGGDTLLIPCMSGVEIKNASAVGATYNETYPCGRYAMQMGAYYDAGGGVMFAAEDPRGRAKKPAIAIGKEISEIAFAWTVPFKKPLGPNRFAPECSASLTLFRGDWYDAGLAYRALLDRLQPPWWSKTVPNPECPKWFRDNAIWIGRWQNYKDYAKWLDYLDALAAWKKYVGTPGQAVHFYEWCLHFTRDWPHNPANPDFVDRTKAMQRAGYRVVPYINGRIWEDRDKRDEDYRFTKVGLPATVKMINGKPSPEPYGNYMFYVICPATATYEQEMLRECDNCVIHGADGVYIDQIGAARHHPCYALDHGHLGSDPDTWYMQGHYKVFRKLREHWKRTAPEAITFGEDIAETVVNTLDGGLTWRWTHEGQVPLFPLVFAGRTQMAGIDWDLGRSKSSGRDIPAVPAKLTFQLFSDCQLGWFSISYLRDPRMREHLPLIKQYAHLRTAMLDFFNSGMMARPPRFEKPQVPVTRYWNKQCTQTVSTEPLQSCAWELDGVKAILVADTAEAPEENTLVTTVPKGTLHRFYSDGRRETQPTAGGEVKLPVALKYREFAAIVAVPEGKDAAATLQRFDEAFKIIAEANHEPGPWDENKDTKK